MIAVDTSARIAILEGEPEKAQFIRLIATDGSARLASSWKRLLETRAGLLADEKRDDATGRVAERGWIRLSSQRLSFETCTDCLS